METCSKMYLSSSFLTLPNRLPTSNCMYSMNSFYNLPANIKETYLTNQVPEMNHLAFGSDYQHTNMNSTSSSNEMNVTELMSCQQDLLQKLRTLQKNVDILQAAKMKEGCDFKKGISSFKLEGGSMRDIVFSVNPSNPLYFLLPIRKQLQEHCKVLVTSSVHSSVNSVDPNVLKLFKDDSHEGRSSFDLIFTVLWKDQPKNSMMVNPLKQIEIMGEANILRYLSRLFPSTSFLNYESRGTAISVAETDYLLDMIQTKILQGNGKERQSSLKFLNSKLGSSKWLDGNSYGLSDVFAWSAIHQLSLEQALSANISSWLQRMNEACDLGVCNGNKSGENEQSSDMVDRFALEKLLKKNQIAFQCVDHKVVNTVDAMMECLKEVPGMHMKNLFLKDKKKNYYLLSTKFDAQINLSAVGHQVGAKDMRFGDEETMFKLLGVKQGCVTPFALLNDSNHVVTPLLDARVKTSTEKYINFHPMTNAATLGVSPQDLLKFLKLTGHKECFVNV